MKSIFISLFFIFLDFSINFGNMRIGLLPTFVGYLLLYRGLKTIYTESPHFAKMQPFSMGMAVYNGLLYILDFLGMSLWLGYIGVFLSFVSMVLGLYILYEVIQGVMEMERTNEVDFYGERLKTTWTVLLIGQFTTFVLLLFAALIASSFSFGHCGTLAFSDFGRL